MKIIFAVDVAHCASVLLMPSHNCNWCNDSQLEYIMRDMCQDMLNYN